MSVPSLTEVDLESADRRTLQELAKAHLLRANLKNEEIMRDLALIRDGKGTEVPIEHFLKKNQTGVKTIVHNVYKNRGKFSAGGALLIGIMGFLIGMGQCSCE